MTIQFEVHVRAFEDGKLAYEQQVGFALADAAQPMAASKRMVEEFARGYHGLRNPSPGELTNVMCNELFHLLREQAKPDERRTLFVSGSLLRLCELAPDAQGFAGLGRLPNPGERVLATIQRETLPGGKARHAATVVSTEVPPADFTPLGTA